jgi:hypothetical protein
MFCRNCGKELAGSPEFCLNCGARPMSGASFCQACGAPTTDVAEICTKCGAKLAKVGGMGWMPTVAGILSIIAGVIGLGLGGCAAAAGALWGGVLAMFGLGHLGGIFAGLAAIPLICAMVAIAGGIYALKRTKWGLALAGCICAILSYGVFLGIAATVFVILGKNEFK